MDTSPLLHLSLFQAFTLLFVPSAGLSYILLLQLGQVSSWMTWASRTLGKPAWWTGRALGVEAADKQTFHPSQSHSASSIPSVLC